jgi:oligopeptide transport system permease protein
MTKFVIRRILVSIPVIFAIALVTFMMVHALPGGPFDTLGDRPMPQRVVEMMEARYGLNEPIANQFVAYIGNLLQGDLGVMYRNPSQNVNEIVNQTFPVSIQLGLLSVALGLVIGIPTGIIAALNHNSIIDNAATTLAVLGVSIPNLVLGPVLILVFGVYLDWFPIAFWGADPPFSFYFLPPLTSEFWTHAVMPVFAIGTGVSASIARLTRAGLLEVLSEDYIRTARSKGLRERAVVVVHALKNSMIPVATLMGPLLAGAVTGSLVVELIFAINGMGRRFVSSVGQREYFLLTSLTLIYSLILIFGNIMVDIMYAWLDPRIRYD